MEMMYCILRKTSSVASELLLPYTLEKNAIEYLKLHNLRIVETRKYTEHGFIQWFVVAN